MSWCERAGMAVLTLLLHPELRHLPPTHPVLTPESKGWLLNFPRIVGAIGGWSLSQYCGASVWIPGVAIILFLVLFTKSPIRPKYFAGAIATTAAHVTWFIVGSAIAGAWSATALDIVVPASPRPARPRP